MTETDGVRQELFIPSMMVIVGLLLDIFIYVMIFRSKRLDFIV